MTTTASVPGPASKTRAAFIGLGTMGRPMATRLLAAGWELAVYDVSVAAMEGLAANGARAAASARDAANGAAFVITMLPNGAHVRDATIGPQGAITGMAAPAILVDMSTIDPGTTKEIAHAAAQRGIRMLDAPVSGSSVGATNGTLTVMVGGETAALEEATPLLSALGQRIIHCGGTGMGTSVKLANQIMAGVSMVAVAEGFLLSQALGVDPQLLFDVATSSSGNCWCLQTRPPVSGVLATSPAERSFEPGFMGDLMRKDLELALTAAQQQSIKLPTTSVARELYASMDAAGLGRKDFSAVYTLLSKKEPA